MLLTKVRVYHFQKVSGSISSATLKKLETLTYKTRYQTPQPYMIARTKKKEGKQDNIRLIRTQVFTMLQHIPSTHHLRTLTVEMQVLLASISDEVHLQDDLLDAFLSS